MKVKELIKALETNPAGLREDATVYMSLGYSEGPCGCALGIAYAAKVGDARQATLNFKREHDFPSPRHKIFVNGRQLLARRLGISDRLSRAIDLAHVAIAGHVTAREIGQYLRRLGSRRFTSAVLRGEEELPSVALAGAVQAMEAQEGPRNQQPTEG